MQQVLQDLTWHITGSFQVLLAAFIKDEAAGKETIGAGDIDRVDIMYASDEERYLPVFTDLNRLHTFKPQLRQRETILIADKQDLLDFLHANEKVAACVVNPGEDDLLRNATGPLGIDRYRKNAESRASNPAFVILSPGIL